MAVKLKAFQFEWDSGNSGKNKRSHNVEDWECEETFFDPRKVSLRDKIHSGKEERLILLGKTRNRRPLYIAYTIRDEKVRVISARDVTKRKEIDLYEKAT
jgi:uncharacterized protein